MTAEEWTAEESTAKETTAEESTADTPLSTIIFLLMIGLSVAWQKRRMTSAERRDYRFLYDILSMNSGRGYYTFERFSEGRNDIDRH